MKIFKIATIVCFLITKFTFSQKLKNDHIQFTYEQYPVISIPKEDKSYNLKLTFPEGAETFNDFELGMKIKLEGYNNFIINGDLTYEMIMGDFAIVDKKIKQAAEHLPMSNAKPNTVFTYEVLFLCPITLKVKNKKNETVYEQTICGNDQYKCEYPIVNSHLMEINQKPKKFYNKIDLENDFNIEKSGGSKMLRKDFLVKQMTSFEKEINKNIGFIWKYERPNFYSAKNKKFEYADLDSAIKNMDYTLGLITGNTQKHTRLNWHDPVINGLVQKSVNIWEKALTENIANTENQRITDELAIALKQNLVWGYYLLDEFEKAKKLASEIVNNENLDKQDRAEMKKLVEETIPYQMESYKKYKGVYF